MERTLNYIERQQPDNLVENLLPPTLRLGALSVYERELKSHIDPNKQDGVIIDKLPLNILQVPLIRQLYPNGKYISVASSVRFDLSCWMQNFKLNSAMANMVDLDRIVELYCIAMETFQICRAKYKLDVFEIKYENLVENLPLELEQLLKFLALEWEDQLESFWYTALERDRIKRRVILRSFSLYILPLDIDGQTTKVSRKILTRT